MISAAKTSDLILRLLQDRLLDRWKPQAENPAAKKRLNHTWNKLDFVAMAKKRRCSSVTSSGCGPQVLRCKGTRLSLPWRFSHRAPDQCQKLLFSEWLQ
jgi:hypothetical protein